MYVLGQVYKKNHTWEMLETKLWVCEIFNNFVLDDGLRNRIVLRMCYIHKGQYSQVCYEKVTLLKSIMKEICSPPYVIVHQTLFFR